MRNMFSVFWFSLSKISAYKSNNIFFLPVYTTLLCISYPAWIHQYDNTAANTVWKKKSALIVYWLVGFPLHCIYFPHPTSTFSVFAAEIYLGPKGKHIPQLSVVQSLTITAPPSPLWLPKHPARSEKQAVQAVWPVFCSDLASQPDQ